MGLFRRKPKVSMEEFCREFYHTQVFNANIAGVDAYKMLCETAFDSVVEADQSFAAIDRARFQEELTAIRMELFALAWMRRFKREDLTVPQSLFTRRYLQEEGKLPIWDIMGEYNQAVARSATTSETGQQVDGPLGRGRVAFVNTLRFEVFRKLWADAAGDESTTEQREDLLNCVARVANRIGADIEGSNCILVKLLGVRLADRLDCEADLTSEALFRLAAVIYGLYQGAREAIGEANLAR